VILALQKLAPIKWKPSEEGTIYVKSGAKTKKRADEFMDLKIN